MKEKDITPKITELGKLIVEHWRMEIYVGCWILFGTLGGVLQLIDKQWVEHLDETGYGDAYVIPIPSISDCLDKLKELGVACISSVYPMGNVHITVANEQIKRKLYECPTLHEALLSALLMALKK